MKYLIPILMTSIATSLAAAPDNEGRGKGTRGVRQAPEHILRSSMPMAMGSLVKPNVQPQKPKGKNDALK